MSGVAFRKRKCKEENKMKKEVIKFKGMNLDVLEASVNGCGEETVLAQKPNGNYIVCTRDSHDLPFNSFARSFKTIEQARKHYNYVR